MGSSRSMNMASSDLHRAHSDKEKFNTNKMFWCMQTIGLQFASSYNYALPAGCIVHWPSYHFYLFMCSLKSISQLQTGCADSRPLWCIKDPVRFFELGPHTRMLCHCKLLQELWCYHLSNVNINSVKDIIKGMQAMSRTLYLRPLSL